MKIPQIQSPMWVGASKVQTQRAASYYNLISMFFMAILAYPQIKATYSWMNMPLMVLFLVIIVVTVVLIDYIVFMLSESTYNVSQAWKSKNLTVRQLIFDELYMEEMSRQLGLNIDRSKIEELVEKRISEKNCNNGK
jgi:hypothetical protein